MLLLNFGVIEINACMQTIIFLFLSCTKIKSRGQLKNPNDNETSKIYMIGPDFKVLKIFAKCSEFSLIVTR